jgi:hypothetical protein
MVIYTGQNNKQRWCPITLFDMVSDPGYQLCSFVSSIGFRAGHTLVKVLQLLNELGVLIFQLLFQCINTWNLLGMQQIIDKILTLRHIPVIAAHQRSQHHNERTQTHLSRVCGAVSRFLELELGIVLLPFTFFSSRHLITMQKVRHYGPLLLLLFS